MNTFTSCGLPWHPVPDDGKIPCDPDQHVRVLLNAEKKGIAGYELGYDRAALFPWLVVGYAGWYPVNPDGTEIALLPSPKALTPPPCPPPSFPAGEGSPPDLEMKCQSSDRTP